MGLARDRPVQPLAAKLHGFADLVRRPAGKAASRPGRLSARPGYRPDRSGRFPRASAALGRCPGPGRGRQAGRRGRTCRRAAERAGAAAHRAAHRDVLSAKIMMRFTFLSGQLDLMAHFWHRIAKRKLPLPLGGGCVLGVHRIFGSLLRFRAIRSRGLPVRDLRGALPDIEIPTFRAHLQVHP